MWCDTQTLMEFVKLTSAGKVIITYLSGTLISKVERDHAGVPLTRLVYSEDGTSGTRGLSEEYHVCWSSTHLPFLRLLLCNDNRSGSMGHRGWSVHNKAVICFEVWQSVYPWLNAALRSMMSGPWYFSCVLITTVVVFSWPKIIIKEGGRA